MRTNIRLIFLLTFSFLVGACSPIGEDASLADLETGITKIIDYPMFRQYQLQNDELILLSENQLNRLKTDYKKQKPNAVQTIEHLESLAEKILNSEIPVVTTGKKIQNTQLNDYVSIGTYWWPNPDTPDGLPYIRRDGVRNPEVDDYSRDELSNFRASLHVLSVVYFVKKENKYASKAIEYLSAWFINNSTKMNPHMKYAQGIPGSVDGRFIGLIEGREFVHVLDSILLIKESKYWNSSIESKIYAWYSDFFKWYSNSGAGKVASDYTNNHASWYDLQVVSYAIATGKNERTIAVLDSVLTKRVQKQIDEEGKQPEELKRSKSLQYSTFNLEALVPLANIGNKYDVDIWESDKYYDSSLIKAIDYLLPYLLQKGNWPHTQIDSYDACNFNTTLYLAYDETGLFEYYDTAQKIVNQFNCEIKY